jgi:hypothetical protein
MPGIPQRISLKAVNNIAIVGTGSGIGDLGSGLLRRFISSYSYEAFGVSMVLEEDRFLLRGLERRGDRSCSCAAAPVPSRRGQRRPRLDRLLPDHGRPPAQP